MSLYNKMGRIAYIAVFCVVASLALTIIFDFLLGEVIVFWYMQSHGVNVRADLSEDMGLGMISFFSSLLSAPVFFSVSFWILWTKTKKSIK